MMAAPSRTHARQHVARAIPHHPPHGPGVAATHPAAQSLRMEAALHAFIEHFEEGVAVVDGSAGALFLNRAARAIVGGVHLRLIDGRLRAGAPSHGPALRKLIARCAADGCGGTMRLAGEDGSLLIGASPVPALGFPPGEAAVLLRLIDPATIRLPDRAALRDQFGLTPTEAAFALELVAGNDLATSAARRGITLGTARVHLRRVFEKTGTHRQAALIRLLLLCPRPAVGPGLPA